MSEELLSIDPVAAWNLMQQDPRALLVDIRSSMEYLFVGHPEGTVHVAWIDEPDWIVNENFVTDIRKLKAFCETLGNYGASFCLDDFGVGHSNLKTLEQLPVSMIKVDRSFVSNIGISERTESIIRHTLRLANELLFAFLQAD